MATGPGGFLVSSTRDLGGPGPPTGALATSGFVRGEVVGPPQRKVNGARDGCLLRLAGAVVGAVAGLVIAHAADHALHAGVPDPDPHGFIVLALLAVGVPGGIIFGGVSG